MSSGSIRRGLTLGEKRIAHLRQERARLTILVDDLKEQQRDDGYTPADRHIIGTCRVVLQRRLRKVDAMIAGAQDAAKQNDRGA